MANDDGSPDAGSPTGGNDAESQVAMTVTRDVDYRGEDSHEEGRDLLDVYMPEGASRAPVVVFFHGGALTFGSKDSGRVLAEQLVPRGVGVVSANYRLSPEVTHPTHVRDAAAAVAWTVDNIAEYGGNTDRLVVSGHSAGGYLAVLLGLDPEFLEAESASMDAVRSVVAISPFLYVEETAADRDESVWGEDPRGWLEASVTPRLRSGQPRARPMLLVYASGDEQWRKAQINRFAPHMVAVGNENMSVVEVPNRDHGSLMTDMDDPDDQIAELIFREVWRTY
ncbi:MAG: alpha/beta hydrolase [Gemmatimonadota bacterium]